MRQSSKREYLASITNRYRDASRGEKTTILDEFCKVCGYNRKYAIRRLSPTQPRRPTRPGARPGRPPRYRHPLIKRFLVTIWKATNLACGKRLVAVIPLWLPAFESHLAAPLPSKVRALILAMSASTIDRLLLRDRNGAVKLGMATTRPGSLLRERIPIRTNQWDETRPGFVEVDSVAHCGTSTAGMYALTINMVDIATTWTEQRSVWGKGEYHVAHALEEMELALPFKLRGLDCDNGGEFLNHHLYKRYTSRKEPVQYTRSRPYRKNDNAHIEQKNWTHVRQYLGYERFDDPLLVDALNDVFRNEWRLFHNFFLPSTKLVSKERVGSRIVKRWDPPKTPVDRVLASPDVHRERKKELRELRATLDPFVLQETIAKKITAILAQVRRNGE